ncbi:amino acid ABC transporter substrate-binding protein [Noviherbaspirillum sp. Root189]|uniref:amino acid ABC transporter substrate-binding protein n=1 Tax=Noviherbaspirillum sp. Root189 TaxID=1736487 RepID=UPI0007103E80|nr:amino acid ABC transporter substrate-binding protein [Noviherbaspirillum sp. Root189]KRB72974.1 amino acid ABC transporter substrate-binding protein [Noviherbaspirillum sp. Root189]
MKKAHGYCRISLGIAQVMIATVAIDASAGETLGRIERSGKVVLGVRTDSVPFSYTDASGKPIGYSMDLCTKLVEAIKAKVKQPDLKTEFLIVTPSSRFSAIVDGKADLDCGPTTNTAERRKLVSFTIPHFVATARMIVRTDSGIKNWSDLRDKTIVTTKGTTNATSIMERNNARALNLKLVEADSDSEAFQKLEKRLADAFAMDDVLLYGLKANSATPQSYDVVGDALTVEPYAIMFSKSDRELQLLVDKEMASIISSGDIYGLYEKWFTKPIPPRNVNLTMPMHPLLRSSFRFPSIGVGD